MVNRFAKFYSETFYVLAVACLGMLSSVPLHAQWATGSEGTIYYNGGGVAVGTTSPYGKVEIDNSPGNLFGDLVVRSDNAGGVGGKLSIVNLGGNSAGSAAVLAFGTDDSTLFDSSGNNASNAEIRAINRGSNNATDLLFSNWSGSAEHVNMVITSGGNVGIGTTAPQYPLSVSGTIQAKEVIVNTGWSDYVFDPKYHLKSLDEVATYIKKYHHLPGMPSAGDVRGKGVSVGEVEAKLLAKVEELTLRMIQLNDENKQLKRQVANLEKR